MSFCLGREEGEAEEEAAEDPGRGSGLALRNAKKQNKTKKNKLRGMKKRVMRRKSLLPFINL